MNDTHDVSTDAMLQQLANMMIFKKVAKFKIMFCIDENDLESNLE